MNREAMEGTRKFPASAVGDRLLEALLDALVTEARIKGVEIEVDDDDVANSPFFVDSLVAVELICAVEPLLEFELKDDIVQSGGYNSVNEAFEHLLKGIERAWLKNSGDSK